MTTTTTTTRPLDELSRMRKIAEPCVMVIFGATGDLTGRKLFPA
jgi:glucose-6-phosphate 1-dehydrogenase